MITIINNVKKTPISAKEKFESFGDVRVGSTFLIEERLHIITQIEGGIISLIAISSTDCNRSGNPTHWNTGTSLYHKLSFEVFNKMITNFSMDDIELVNITITID